MSKEIGKQYHLDEKIVAENLSHKINYLNMDSYVGVGYFMWSVKRNSMKNDIQPFNILFTTRLDTTNTIKGQNKLIGLDLYPNKLQPFIEGNLKTFSGRGAMMNFGYGIRLINTKNNWFISGSVNIEGAYIRINIDDENETWNYNTSEALNIKSFYEGDAGVKIGFHKFSPKRKWFNYASISVGLSKSVDPINRTFNLIKSGESQIIDTKEDSYTSGFITCNLNICDQIQVNLSYKQYKELNPNGYNGLTSAQLLIRLNKN